MPGGEVRLDARAVVAEVHGGTISIGPACLQIFTSATHGLYSAIACSSSLATVAAESTNPQGRENRDDDARSVDARWMGSGLAVARALDPLQSHGVGARDHGVDLCCPMAPSRHVRRSAERAAGDLEDAIRPGRVVARGIRGDETRVAGLLSSVAGDHAPGEVREWRPCQGWLLVAAHRSLTRTTERSIHGGDDDEDRPMGTRVRSGDRGSR